MIDNLTISYECNGIGVTLCPTDFCGDERLPFVLPPMLERMFHDCAISEKIILELLCSYFGYKIEKKDNHKTT